MIRFIEHAGSFTQCFATCSNNAFDNCSHTMSFVRVDTHAKQVLGRKATTFCCLTYGVSDGINFHFTNRASHFVCIQPSQVSFSINRAKTATDNGAIVVAFQQLRATTRQWISLSFYANTLRPASRTSKCNRSEMWRTGTSLRRCESDEGWSVCGSGYGGVNRRSTSLRSCGLRIGHELPRLSDHRSTLLIDCEHQRSMSGGSRLVHAVRRADGSDSISQQGRSHGAHSAIGDVRLP